MKNSFIDTYEHLFKDAFSRFKKTFAVKIITARKCHEIETNCGFVRGESENKENIE